MGQDNYCGFCCDLAAKAGRAVRMTDVYDYPLCTLCESRVRNGLVHYRPSNGTEGRSFMSRCYQCRHCTDDPANPVPGRMAPPYAACQFGVFDRVLLQMAYAHDHACNWFDAADITDRGLCLRFTDKNDPNGEMRDPPPPDVEGQMFFGDLDVPTEREPVRSALGVGG